jgi:ABC-type sugar transport system substrate-binding protein
MVVLPIVGFYHVDLYIHVDRSIPSCSTATALTGTDTKLDAKSIIPLSLTDVLSGLDYDPGRMKTAIYDAIQYPTADALIVSIPDYEALKDPILAAKAKNIPIIAVYSGLQAAKDLGILAVMSDDV